MTLMAIAFYLMAAVTTIAGLMVITAKNPVHSVLFLILAFFSAAGLFVLLGAEFLAMLLVVVYVGAVAVLFLFVVMMLDVDFTKLRQGFANYLAVGGLIALLLLFELVMISIAVSQKGAAAGNQPYLVTGGETNIKMIGHALYGPYIYLFEAAGFVLLVAMIGAIVLTLRHRPSVKRQDIYLQVTRRRTDAVEVVPAKTGEGISE